MRKSHLIRIMTSIFAALLLCLAVKTTYAVEPQCRISVRCPCGTKGDFITICVPPDKHLSDVCARFSKCASCEENLNFCSKCPEGFNGPFCTQEIKKFREKRQAMYPVRWRLPRQSSSSCLSLDSPKPGSIRCVYGADQQSCTGRCSPGYRFQNQNTNEMVLTCRDGTWSPRRSFPECKSAGYCELDVFGAGSFNCTIEMDGKRCDIRCNNRYQGQFFCLPQREWQPALPSCVRPKPIVGESRECPCQNGGTCDSSGRCVCPAGRTGQYCETAIRQKVTCRDPGFVKNSIRSSADDRIFEEGWSVVYVCISEEYILQGSAVLICQDDGTWSSPLPRCIKPPTAAPVRKATCRDPGSIPNGVRRNTDGSYSSRNQNYEEGKSVVYVCRSEEYALQGSALLTCQKDGTWSSSLPRCIVPPTAAPEVVCPDPGQVANAERLNMDGSPSVGVRQYKAGQSVVYTCQPGFALQRRSLITCLASGAWSFRTPYCTRVTPPNPVVTTTPRPALPELRFCPDPGVDADGSRRPITPPSRRGFPQGSRLEYACDQGFDLSGERSLFCLTSGDWSASRPRCIGGQPRAPVEPEVIDMYCQNPGTISNGKVVYYPALTKRTRPTPEPAELDDPEYPVESRLEYYCNSGYSLVGSSTLVCESSGFWSNEAPVCERDPTALSYCKYPGEIAKGRVVHIPTLNERRRPSARNREAEEEEQYPAGSKLQYTCDEGYEMEGIATITCEVTGRWSNAPPKCADDDPSSANNCDNPGPVLNGRVWYYPPPTPQQKKRSHGISLDYDQDEYPEETQLAYSCDEGYRIKGSRRLICQAGGIWSDEIPICIPDCGRSFLKASHRVRNGNMTFSGDWPWVVSLQVESSNSSTFLCGGAVLSGHTVLTAAHCLVAVKTLTLRFGKHNFRNRDDDTEVLVIKSREMLIHPQYSNQTLDNDIGLIKLAQRIRFSVRVQPVCLPDSDSSDRNIMTGRMGHISGWGETELAVAPDELMLASLPVVNNGVCQEFFRPLNLTITDNMFCAGYEDARQSVCGGDSGSPFVFYDTNTERYTVEGLVSFGVRGQCGVAGKYATFTKVSKYRDWILRNLK